MSHKRKRVPWNKGKILPQITGTKHPFWGKHHSAESNERNRLAHLGRVETMEHRVKISISLQGGTRPPRTVAYRKKMSMAKQLPLCARKPKVMRGRLYPPNWDEIKKSIYMRDAWTCCVCNTKCVSKKSRDSERRIQCHHIDHDSSNNSASNLITLCASCHSKTKYNKKMWMGYLKRIVALMARVA